MNSQNTAKENQESNKRNTKSQSNDSNLDNTSETSSSKDKNSNVEENTSNQKKDSSQETENSETQQESNQEKTSSEDSNDTKENNIKDNQTNQSNSEETPSPSEEAKETRENQENKDLEDNQSAKEANESKDENQDKKKTIEDIQKTSNSSENLESRKESLERLKETIKHYAQKKQQMLRQDLPESQSKKREEKSQNEEIDYQNKFLEELKKDLPSFKERNRGDGYSIDTNGTTELPNSLVRTLITKFLNQRFCKKNSDLNVRSNSLEKTDGFYKWDVKNIIVHLKTNQLNKVLNDKYGYDYDFGKSEFVPLSFYFDMSGSMSRYTNMLAVLAIELLKKDVKVLIGFNEKINVQIDRIASTMDIKELASILSKAGYSSYGHQKNDILKESRISCKFIERNIDNYLIEKQAEKCVVFADCDPIDEVITLSKYAEVYWFCFENQLENEDLTEYKGFLYQVENAQNIAEGLVKVSEKRFESLVFLDNPKILQKEE